MDEKARVTLAACPLFEGLDDTTLGVVVRGGTTRTLARREMLFVEGDAADAFFVVLSGRLKLTQSSAEGHEVIVRYVGPGEMCAVVALFPGDVYPATAEAVAETRVAVWASDRLAVLLSQHARLTLNALHLLSDRTRELTSRVREMATEKVARRVARTLLRLARKTGRRVEGGVLLDLSLPREDIAEMTGTTLFTVSRLLAEWERRGIIEAGRERVLIRHPHALTAIAEDLPQR